MLIGDTVGKGSSKTWRCHLQAAWKFLQLHQNSKAWTNSADAWYVTQSIHLLKIGCDSSGFIEENYNSVENTATNDDNAILAKEVMCDPGYGWTLGTSSSVMETIADINTAAKQLERDDVDDAKATISLRLHRKLLRCQREALEMTDLDDVKGMPQHLHLQAFQAATVIYYYQVCDEVTPRQLSRFVSTVLSCVTAFFQICGGSFTLWPVFIAAAETYKAEDQVKVMTLLENMASVGMRNISNYTILLRQIWTVRGLRAVVKDQEVADTRVDWREVMRELEMDVLIL